jgi:hypothetical protein
MFSATYRADDASWAAAVDLDAAARAGVLSYLRLRITGRLKQAQTLLGARVHGDLAGVHATGIAVHTLVHALERMRSLWSDTSGKPRPSAEQALAHSLRPPQRILRQAVAGGDSPAGALHAGGLAVLELEQAYAADPRPEIAFMSGTWSRCPAAAAVPRLLAQVWETAIADDAKPGPWFGPAEGLRLGWSEAQSVDQQHAYRRVAGLVLLLQFAAAAVLLLAPSWAAALAGVQAAPGWQRFGGGLMLTWLLYAAPALIAPLQSRLANFATAAAAVLVGAFACAVGGRLLWVGLAEALLGLVLAWRYWRLLVAELMSRP